MRSTRTQTLILLWNTIFRAQVKTYWRFVNVAGRVWNQQFQLFVTEDGWLSHCFTISLHSCNEMQFACQWGCAREYQWPHTVAIFPGHHSLLKMHCSFVMPHQYQDKPITPSVTNWKLCFSHLPPPPIPTPHPTHTHTHTPPPQHY